MPVADPTVATAVFPLVHVPPDVLLENVVVAATQITLVPIIEAGSAFTVTTAVLKHPVVRFVTVIVAVPALTPATTPLAEPTAATLLLLLVQ